MSDRRYCEKHGVYDSRGACPYCTITNQANEIARLENLLASGVHTCSATCKRPLCQLRSEKRELESAAAEVVRWRKSLAIRSPTLGAAIDKLAALLQESE